MTAPVLFKESDLKRAVNAVRATGLDVRAVEVCRDGTIRVVTSKIDAIPDDPFEQFQREDEIRTA